jgi:hypothetical protein
MICDDSDNGYVKSALNFADAENGACEFEE